jgi:hypothetical protein
MAQKDKDRFPKKEAAQRFEAALKGARLVKLEVPQPNKTKAKKRR